MKKARIDARLNPNAMPYKEVQEFGRAGFYFC